MGVNREAKQLVEQLGDLPALPTVVSEVLQLTNDPDSAASDVTKAVEKDPALAAKVLRVSNSSYYGMKQYVGTLKLALVILGAREVRNIVLGISVFDALSCDEDSSKLVEQVWNDSLVIGGLNKMMATEMRLGLQGEEFICGLLCDIGKMALFQIQKKNYRSILEEAAGNVEQLLMLERNAFGMTHGEVASALSMRWNLPQSLTDSLWHQYPVVGRNIMDARDPKLAALLRISRRATKDNFSGGSTPRCLTDEEAWAAFDTARQPIPAEERKAVLEGFIAELKQMPQLPL